MTVDEAVERFLDEHLVGEKGRAGNAAVTFTVGSRRPARRASRRRA